MPVAFSAADITANLVIDVPELYANSANKFFDSLASGTPVFINFGGWQADILRGRNCGIVGWKEPISVIAQNIANKIQNKEWLSTTGNNARDVAEKMFDRNNLADKVEKVITCAYERKVEDCHLFSIDIS